MGVGDNISGLVWVTEWTSVLVIILRIPKKRSQAKYRKRKRKSGTTKDHGTKQAVFIY